MIIIRTIEELESERARQRKAWINAGKKEDSFFLNLEDAFLSEAYLSGADLTGAHLSVAYLKWANLMRSNLTEAHLCGANLSEAYLMGSNLTEAHLCWANLKGADLRGAKLSGALTEDTIITKSQWDMLAELYSQKFMGGFIIKELDVPINT